MHSRVILILFFTLLLDMIGFGMIIPIIPVLFTDASSPSFLLQGYSIASQYYFSGFIAALYGLMQFIAAPILGELSDVYGRKRLLIFGVAVLALSQIMFGFGVSVGSLAMIIVSRACGGLAGANFSVAQAAIADITEPKDRAKNFGLIGAAFGAGFILGPLIGGFIADMFPHLGAAPFLFAGVLGLVNVAMLALFLPETHHVRSERQTITLWKGVRNIRQALGDADARPVFTANFFYQVGFAFFTSFIGILLVSKFSFSASEIGVFFGIVGVWIMITQVIILRVLAKKYSERTILWVSLPLLAVGLASYPYTPSVAILYALIIPVTAVTTGLINANITALISKGVSSKTQGTALGVNGSVMALAQSIAPLLSGLVGGLMGLFVPFLVGAACVFSAWGILFASRRNL